MPINLRYWKLYRDNKISKQNLRYNRLAEVFKALKVTIPDAKINQLANDYITYLSSFKTLLPGAVELLNYLKPKYNLHIITNGFEEVQHKKLINSNLKQFFKVIVTSETVGVKKPNPLVFENALLQSNATAAQSIMIGDNLEADIQGALALNMRAIYYSPLDVKSEPGLNSNYYTVSHLSQIQEIL